MNIAVSALAAPTQDSLDAWLNTPRLAKCGEFFTPSEPMWWPDRSTRRAINWQAAIACVPADWQRWLHAALAYRTAEVCTEYYWRNFYNTFARGAGRAQSPQ